MKNMYSWITKYFPTIKGLCPYDCSYCYVKAFYKRFQHDPTIRLDYDVLKSNPGSGQHIFVDHTIDMCAQTKPNLTQKEIDDNPIIPFYEMHIDKKRSIPDSWIFQTLDRIQEINDYNLENKLAKNVWYIQTRNTQRLFMLLDSEYTTQRVKDPETLRIGTTLESNIAYPEITKAPSPESRALFLGKIHKAIEKYATLEPLLKFHLEDFVELIKISRATTVIIGADSKKTTGLQEFEPTKQETKKLITVLSDLGYNVILKSNLDRIIK